MHARKPELNPRPVSRRVGANSLVWLLLLAIALMGLTITRQQVLGSSHRHTGQDVRGASSLSSAVANLASDWRNRWRQQPMLGHSALRLRGVPDVLRAGDPADQHDHHHDALERHHHATGDGSVVALDGAAQAAESADAGSTSVPLAWPGVATPSAGQVVTALHDARGPWPVDRGVAVVSRSVAPALRPPAV